MARAAGVALFRIGRLLASATRAFNHLAAGTLTIDELRRGIERTWEDFSASDEAITSGLMDWEEEVVSRFVAATDSVLLVGSGPGRDLVALVQRGYRVTAVEPARRANETAKRHLANRGLTAPIIEGFFEDVPLPGCFDVIIFSYCCYSFIPGSPRRVAALRKAADHLTAGGRVIVSYLTERSGHPMLIRLARLSATISRSDWRPEAGDILHSIDTTAPVYHYEHPFAAAEIDEEARRAGLRPLHHRAGPGTPVVVLTR